MHFQRSRGTLDSLKSVFNAGGNRRWVPLVFGFSRIINGWLSLKLLIMLTNVIELLSACVIPDGKGPFIDITIPF